jgi:CRISPR system Cascade subunit CasC
LKNLTLHIVNTLPWSNLNRDDTGTPKRAIVGGVLRGMLSSQSIKRAARGDYEARSLDKSIRSTNLAGIITDRAREINPGMDVKSGAAAAKKLVSALVKNAGRAEEQRKESGTSSWLSMEEIETAAAAVASGATMVRNGDDEEPAPFVERGVTGSLSIAAFGRMFAAAPELSTEAAVAVSPAMSVHKAVIETDYFSAVDEDPNAAHRGASFLGVASYTSGVFYRSVTIDREQLKRSWTGMSGDNAKAQLALMVEALIYKLPSGKRKATAPYVAPLAVLAEEQSYRLAYDFETPVLPGSDGGYGEPAVNRLAEQRSAALEFDKGNFGISLVAGTAAGLDRFDAETTSVDGIVEAIVEWILA